VHVSLLLAALLVVMFKGSPPYDLAWPNKGQRTTYILAVPLVCTSALRVTISSVTHGLQAAMSSGDAVQSHAENELKLIYPNVEICMYMYRFLNSQGTRFLGFQGL
jgi:hypothetical protein